MIISPRLTRAALVFLLFGTTAALLPTQDSAALAGNGCFTGPSGTSGQFAIAPSSSDIRENYLLIPTPTTYRFFYKTESASPYKVLTSGTSTTFFVNSGQVVIDTVAYPAGSHPIILNTKSSFAISQATVYTAGKPANVPGSLTFTTTYPGSDPSGNISNYTATITLSTP